MATSIFFYLFFFSFVFVRSAPSTTLLLANLKSPFQSWNKTVLLAQSNDKQRLSYLSSLAVARGPKAPAPVSYNQSLGHMFVVRIQIGTPPQKLFMAIDTSHDVALVPCSGPDTYNTLQSRTFTKVNCSEPQCPQAGIIVDPRTCGPKSKDTCVFRSTYRDSDSTAELVRDNIILGRSDSIPSYTFGCIKTHTGTSIPTQGMLGLGRQSLSLLSQTLKFYKYTFSYCLPSLNSRHYFPGSLTLGTGKQSKNIKTTPFVGLNNLYRVNLTGIMVGKRVLNITKDKVFGGSGSGIGNGAVIDSGTVYTVLVLPAYNAVRRAIQRIMKSDGFILGGFDTCFKVHNAPRIGNITLMFPGMNFTLVQENFIIRSGNKKPFTYCLAMSTHPRIGYNVIGSFQQQNRRFFFDIPKSRLGVAEETCS